MTTENIETSTYRTVDIPSKVSFSGGAGFLFALLLPGLFVVLGLMNPIDNKFIDVSFYIVGLVVFLFVVGGFYILEPNESAVIIFFGKYKGTDRVNGLRWIPPFYDEKKKSFKIHNFNSETMKINDKDGNPIEFAAIISYRVSSPAQAEFDVDTDDFESFIENQSETALRKTVGSYPYDHSQDSDDANEITLRGDSEEVSNKLKSEVQERLRDAGVSVLGVEISHLAYAPEIAQAMLQRQQAKAMVAAKTTIVQGSVGIIKTALEKVSEENMGNLTDADKNQIISNMLLVLAGDTNAQPVIHTQQSQRE